MTAIPLAQRPRFEWLVGNWRLARSISDGSRGCGTAQIVRVGSHSLEFHEVIELVLSSGETIHGSRAFTIEEDGAQIALKFADGSNSGAVFQRFRLSSEVSISSHSCGDDLYQSKLTWINADSFELSHTVSGPEKSYVLTTRYSRATGIS